MRIRKLNEIKTENTIKSVFIEWQSANRLRGLSFRTIDNYERVINYLEEFMDVEQQISVLDDETVIALITHLKATTKMNNNSINNVLRSTNVFLKYCTKKYKLPPVTVQLLKVKSEVKPIFSEHQLAILLKKPNLNDCGWHEFRSWAWCNVLFNTGIRLTSLANLKVSDIDFESKLLTVNTTKNKRGFQMKISPSLAQCLRLYLKYRPKVETDFLWINEYGQPLTVRSYSTTMSRYVRDRIPDIPSEYTNFHIWRRTFATYSLKYRNLDIHSLQVLLGHSHISTTSLYTKNFSTLDIEDFDMMDTIKQRKVTPL